LSYHEEEEKNVKSPYLDNRLRVQQVANHSTWITLVTTVAKRTTTGSCESGGLLLKGKKGGVSQGVCVALPFTLKKVS